MSKTIVKVTIIEQDKPIYFESELKIINLNKFTQQLTKLKIVKKNQIEFIRFKNSYNAWELLSSNTPDYRYIKPRNF